MPATAVVIDFQRVIEPLTHKDGDRYQRPGNKKNVGPPVTSKVDRQIRRRIRRTGKILEGDLQHLYGDRPISEWDHEELARGRPRNKNGDFTGPAPKWLTREVHEQIVQRFESVVKEEMNGHTVSALKVIGLLIDDNRVDDKGKPLTAAGTKLDAAKFLIEHVIGKPKQRVESDISVKLQGILGMAMVNPSQTVPGQLELTQGYVDAPSWEGDDDDLDYG